MTLNRKRIIIISVAVILILLIIWTVWGNTALQLNTYEISSDKISDSFDGFKIAQVSDLHNAQMGDNNEKLLNMLKKADPDIIAITGDFIDSYNTDVDVAINFAEEAEKIAPCYYVRGNHEARLINSSYITLQEGLQNAGVEILENECIEIEKDGQTINLLGIDDPSLTTYYCDSETSVVAEDELSSLTYDDTNFTVLLSHRPELLDIYVKHDIDLVLAGHAHGGQFRLPFIGGLYAPDQGLLPEFDSGVYTKEDTNMIVSRGIGSSIFPFRFNNRPEVVSIELKVI